MAKLISTNPGKNYEVIGKVRVSTPNEIKQKVQKAHQALDQWNNLGLEGRVKLLRKVADEILKRKENLARLASQEMGMPISQTRYDTEYGLGAYIYTEDRKRAEKVAKQIKTGGIAINNASYIHPCSPFGSYKESGIGREHGRFGFEELTQVKVIATEKP